MKPLVKIQIILLLIVTALVIWRARVSPVQFDGVVAVSRIDEGSLVERHFEIRNAPIRAVISATGAYETDEQNARPAAYLWLLDRESDDVVWSMLGGDVRRDKVLMNVVDTTTLDPGRYTALYTALGPTSGSRGGGSFLGLRPHWTNDTQPFGFSISVASESAGRFAVVDAAHVSGRKRDGILWDVSRLGNREKESFMFRATSPVTLGIRAQLEICYDDGCDEARIEELTDGRTVWSLSEADALSAGGGSANRRFTGTVDLAPGVYRAVVETDRGHALDRWSFNPPHNPYFWGMTIDVRRGRVQPVDPWNNGNPLVGLMPVGDDENRRARIEVSDTVIAYVAGMGEIWSSGTRYDYGWLERDSNGERIWDMTYETSDPAGGDGTNRKSEQILTLTPGTYTLYYQSDDSHSYEDWLRTRPTHPERWGAALFILGSGEEDGAVRVVEEEDAAAVVARQAAEVAAAGRAGLSLAEHVRARNYADFSSEFTLDDSAAVRINAAGEISSSGRYDYGWIANAATEERVWEMTLQNTEHAGGEARNRRFEGIVTLPPGRYVVRYVSDFDYAYGDFGDDAPNRPEEWGISVRRMSSERETRVGRN